jgi:hypothetical protein
VILWFLSDFARVAHEQEAIDRLVATTDWLTGIEWGIAGANLVVKFDVRARDFRYELQLEYPSLFPSVPAIVRPRSADARLSGHQYGAGGSLCLEWRPDNWSASVTGAELIESAYRLLETENPGGVAVGQRGGTVDSAHLMTAGQELRASGLWLRLFVSRDASSFLNLRTAPERGEATLSLRNHRNCAVFILRAARFDDALYEEKLASDELLGASPVVTPVLVSGRTAAELKLAKQLTDFGCEIREEDLAARWLVVVSRNGAAHLFLNQSEGELIAGDTVTQESVAVERTPNQFRVLRERSVAIIGAGSLGTKIATSLARMGVGRFLIVDDDVVLPENLERNALDWVAMAQHKASATADAIERISPSSKVEDHRIRLTGQESSAVLAALVTKIAACDIIIDVTANPRNFNIVAAAATSGRKALLWAEVLGGGKGGVISRSVPDVDPPPDVVRLKYLEYCDANPGPNVPASDYGLQTDTGAVLVASDADVAVVAHHVVRMASDALVNSVPEHEAPIYLIGLSKWWIFRAPFDTLALSIPREQWPPPQAGSQDEIQAGVEFVRALVEKRAYDLTSS